MEVLSLFVGVEWGRRGAVGGGKVVVGDLHSIFLTLFITIRFIICKRPTRELVRILIAPSRAG